MCRFQKNEFSDVKNFAYSFDNWISQITFDASKREKKKNWLLRNGHLPRGISCLNQLVALFDDASK